MSYSDFLARKRMVDPATGMAVVPALPSFLFPHQADIVSWALRRGRAEVFAGTGLGKTAMELAWADAVSAHTDKPSLVFAPLAVAAQHIREADKFGLPIVTLIDTADIYGGPGDDSLFAGFPSIAIVTMCRPSFAARSFTGWLGFGTVMGRLSCW